MYHLQLRSISPAGIITSYAINEFSFPAGEGHVRLPAEEMAQAEEGSRWELEARVYSPAEIMGMFLTLDATKRTIPAGSFLRLVLPYVPFARQDRVAVDGEPLSVAMMCSFINMFNLNEIEVWDPHSDVTTALLTNVRVRSTKQLMIDAFSRHQAEHLLSESTLLAPDAGARKRVAGLAKAFGVPVIYADKTRDIVSGKLSAPEVHGDIPERPITLVDDCADGGFTFIQLAKLLRTRTTQPLYLYVTHGLFTKGLDELKQYFDGIFTANCKDASLEDKLGFTTK